jgi:hypothetical protein
MAPTIYSGCPGLSIQERQEALQSAVHEVSGSDIFKDKTSPQWLAFQWLLNGDGLRMCPDDEHLLQRYAFAVFYFATVGDEWLACTRDGSTECSGMTFLSRFHECTWGGVTCGPGRRVLQINLDSTNLQGTVPQEIRLFSRLLEFDVDNNTIGGTIPSVFGDMSNLMYLDLDNNNLSGPIPEEIYNLTSLMALDLDTNQLNGTISTKIGQLVNLAIVQYDLNQLTGTIPTEAGLLQNLGYFTATGNNFTGSVPAELCGVPSDQLIANCSMCQIPDCCTMCTNTTTANTTIASDP